ncbi:MerR family transcriptional regulator [Paenibacillus sp. MMS20-IR301]|uniref:MerR family transcriptional regulator n=1 Tax=Paenibacillus sp. MMS20-IR301 TaxID=2895946 RepID=UPI0028EAFF72|nr:MerR family transcriptional regulator [Paenibacillus sp. MMS20-IR301]WNS45971.1 MerR family transcriptional regulator [Paenibacillus sp. MMS20-IR301]
MMNRSVAIHHLSEQLGLTSRTLRHWEAEGLFDSSRDPSSGWRVYDEHALLNIRITAVLRKMDIPIKEIKPVIRENSVRGLRVVIADKLSSLRECREEVWLVEQQLTRVMEYLGQQDEDSQTLDNILTRMEAVFMSKLTEQHVLRIVTLPPMRVAFNIAVDLSPEDKAIKPIVEWLESAQLLGTARLFGGNVKPMPGSAGKPYGYGMCATIPQGTAVPEPFKEMMLPGGLYALLDSSDDIGGSWTVLMDHLSHSTKYQSDRSRLCLEEHIRNDTPAGGGNEYHLNLLEPVITK